MTGTMPRRHDPLTVARLALAGLALAAGAANAQTRAHVHGQATLRVAVEGGTVAIEFAAPLEGLLGFERQPRTPAERAAVEALRARFAAPGELFRLDAPARCTVASSSVESPLLDGKATPGEHADLQASVTFTCAEPARLRALDVRLFADHPQLARIRVETVGTGGPARRELRRGAATVPLGRPG
jgi:hypothetical protein